MPDFDLLAEDTGDIPAETVMLNTHHYHYLCLPFLVAVSFNLNVVQEEVERRREDASASARIPSASP